MLNGLKESLDLDWHNYFGRQLGITMRVEIYILSIVPQIPSQMSTFDNRLHLCAPGFTHVKVHSSTAYKSPTKQKNKAGNDSMSINNKLDN